jgi:hypothetical protein
LESLRIMLATHRLLFIGVSFADEYFEQQLKWLRETFGGESGPHFALVHSDRFDATRAALKNVDVECVEYSDHGPALLALVREFTTIAGRVQITPAPQPTLPPTSPQAAVKGYNRLPGCANMAIDASGQGSSAESFHILLDLRFGRGQLKDSDITLEYSIAEAELIVDHKYCEWDGPRLGDIPPNPHFIPEPDKWRITGPVDSRDTLAGSVVHNEALCRFRGSSRTLAPSVDLLLTCHRSHIRYNILDGNSDSPVETSSNKCAIIAAFTNKCQWGEGGWLELSKAMLTWEDGA